MADEKKFDLGKWGTLTVGGLAAAVLTAVLTQYTECKPSEEPGTDPVVDAGEPAPEDAGDVIDAALPEEDAAVAPVDDAGAVVVEPTPEQPVIVLPPSE